MIEKLLKFINLSFKKTPISSTMIVENKHDVVDLGNTITVPEDIVVEKKKRGRKKKEDTIQK